MQNFILVWAHRASDVDVQMCCWLLTNKLKRRAGKCSYVDNVFRKKRIFVDNVFRRLDDETIIFFFHLHLHLHLQQA
jgi:hypothetical protein